jgi:hypothetical protein
MNGLRFTEELHGWLSFDEDDYNQAFAEGRRAGRSAALHLTIAIPSLDRFLADREMSATATGWVRCDELGGRLAVEVGVFNLFLGEGDRRRKRMKYRLFLRDRQRRPLTLTAFKVLQDDPNYDSWADSTTAFTRLLAGHVSEADERAQDVVATGILRLRGRDFVRQLTTFRGTGPGRLRRAIAPLRFQSAFMKGLLDVYRGPTLTPDAADNADFPRSPVPRSELYRGYRPGEWHPVRGRRDLERRIVPVHTEDGLELNLHHLRGPLPATRGPVMLAHGAGCRAQHFYGVPIRTTCADALIEAGYDVWVQSWRGSIDFPPRPWSLDEVAAYDHPAMVRMILSETGRDTLKAVVHCQGSSSFAIATVAGLVPQVTAVVSTAVSLHPVVPLGARVKQRCILPVAGALTPYVDPQWAIRPPSPFAAFIARVAKTVRRECDHPVCQMANYIYGYGPELLWRHANLESDTHDWAAREFGYCPFKFLRQLARSVRAGELVPVDGIDVLPASYTPDSVPTEARWTFVTGAENRMFLPAGHRRTFEYFDGLHPGHHEWRLLPDFTHLDMYFGRDAPKTTFPVVLEALEHDEKPPRRTGRFDRPGRPAEAVPAHNGGDAVPADLRP